MWTTRFIVMTAGAAVAAIVLAIAGGVLALHLAAWKISIAGVEQVFMDAGSPSRVVRMTAIVFAIQPVIAWIALAIRRGRGGRDVRPVTAVIVVVGLVAMVFGASALDAWGTAAILSAQRPGDLRPMFDIELLAVGSAELRISVVVAIALWVGVAVRTRRA
ncbi:MAG: hypothetical protein ABI867_30700 [Kofleriaceae bacterium]